MRPITTLYQKGGTNKEHDGVAYGSLVEVCDARVWTEAIPRCASSKWSASRRGTTSRTRRGAWAWASSTTHGRIVGLTGYMGLRADGVQMILVDRQMMRSVWGGGGANAGLSLVLERDRRRIDGVVCMTVLPESASRASRRTSASACARGRCHGHAAGKEQWSGRPRRRESSRSRLAWPHAEPRVHTVAMARDGARGGFSKMWFPSKCDPTRSASYRLLRATAGGARPSLPPVAGGEGRCVWEGN